MTYKNCIYYLPKELGHVRRCLRFDICNELGSSCAGFARHTDETRKALAEAIELRKKGTEK